MMDLALRLRQIELATKAHRSSAGSSSVFLAIVQWKNRSASERVSASLRCKSRGEPRGGGRRGWVGKGVGGGAGANGRRRGGRGASEMKGTIFTLRAPLPSTLTRK